MESIATPRVKRNERIGAMIKILTEAPNHVFTLSRFSDLFGAAKSTISEDVDIAQRIFTQFGLGQLETVAGAAGGVRYLPLMPKAQVRAELEGICHELDDPGRMLPGGYLYISDILTNPATVEAMGRMLAAPYLQERPDFVLTLETQGIPVALMTARALQVPLVLARRNSAYTDGSVVTINYVTGSSRRLTTMSLSRRAVQQGQRALVIDDFMRGGGSARGLVDLMHEFGAGVIGIGVVIATKEPERKLVSEYRCLLELGLVDEAARKIEICPSANLMEE